MKHWNVPIDARGDLAHAVITSGGVSVREVDPRTMQSKKALGLYFAGEVLDVDAYTGATTCRSLSVRRRALRGIWTKPLSHLRFA